MNKRLAYIIIFFFVVCNYLQAQNLSGWSNTYLGVSNYDGAVNPEAITLRFEYSGNRLNVPNWKLSVKLRSPIVAGDGTVFPSEKVSLVPVRAEGQVNNPGPPPTISQIGMPSPVALNGLSETYLVPSSNAPLYNVSPQNTYYDLRLIFNLVVAGGSYLSTLQGGVDYQREYLALLRFTAYRSDNTLIGVFDTDYKIQVHMLPGTPPADPFDPKYSISISGGVEKSVLEFKSLSDYINGVNITYSNGLQVTSNVDYQVTVRSLSSSFTAVSDNALTLPLDVVKVQVGMESPVLLSSTVQTVLSGSKTNDGAANFDIRYFTGANDQRLFSIQSDNYTTSLTYEIVPR